MLARLLVLVSLLGVLGSAHAQPTIRPEAIAQIEALIADKAARTPTEHKVDSNLLHAEREISRRRAGDTRPGLPFVETFIATEVSPDNSVHLNIRANVSDRLLAYIEAIGGREVASFPQYDTITVRLPLDVLRSLAAQPEVRFIAPLERPITNTSGRGFSTGPVGIGGIMPQVGAVTSAGVTAHAADRVHTTGVSGVGGSVCVISDGIDLATTSQATGDLPALVVLPGQQGNGREGTAMLEIVYDMAPGAQLGFATAAGGEAQMATNITNLRSAGCSIIVDDIKYPGESAFQDGPIARAVASVQASGAIYFSSAANYGNLNDGTSSTWEGDWADSGFVLGGSPLHSFGTAPYNVIRTPKDRLVVLQWADPFGASANDYDLYVYDATGTVLIGMSQNVQNGFGNPLESVFCGPPGTTCPAGATIYVTRYSGAARALRLDTFGSTMDYRTAGSTVGHNATPSLSVAAVDAATAFGGPFVGGAANPVEISSSDGPRKMFFHPNGAADLPGFFGPFVT